MPTKRTKRTRHRGTLSQAEASRAARRHPDVVAARERHDARLIELTGSADPRGVLRIEPDAELARLEREYLETFARMREELMR